MDLIPRPAHGNCREQKGEGCQGNCKAPAKVGVPSLLYKKMQQEDNGIGLAGVVLPLPLALINAGQHHLLVSPPLSSPDRPGGSALSAFFFWIRFGGVEEAWVSEEEARKERGGREGRE